MGREVRCAEALRGIARIVNQRGAFGPLAFLQGGYMNEPIETIKISRPECPGGYCVINKSDLRPEDVLYAEEKKTANRKGKKP